MSFLRSLYPNFVNEAFYFDSDLSQNTTCNIILTKNNTLIEIDRGWEGIPESFVINITICLFLILGFAFVRNLAKLKQHDISSNNTWLEFIYGDRTNRRKKLTSRRLCDDSSYLQTFNESLQTHLPLHTTNKCKVATSYSSQSNGSPVPIDSENFTPIPSTSRDNTESEIVNVDESGDDDTIVINPSNIKQGSSNHLVDKETTFPINNTSNYPTEVLLNFIRVGSIYRFNNWISNCFYISDFDICEKKGPDAYHYLLFQRYIIYFLAVLSFVSIVVILPVNIQGNNEGKAFQRTTLSNLQNDSNLYWVHAISSALTVVLGVYLMSRFSKALKTDDDLISRKTLFIRRIPIVPQSDMKVLLKNYFSQNFPDHCISGIQFLYDCRKLEELDQEYVNALEAIKYCNEHCEKHGPDHRINVRPYTFGRLGCCCSLCCCSKLDALEYYSEQKEKLAGDINTELKDLLSLQSIGSAFIAFQTEKMAMEVYRIMKQRQKQFYDTRFCFCSSDSSDEFDLKSCLISYAPYPYDINWRDIAVDIKLLWLRKICLYLLLFVVFFFLSTPAILLNALELISSKESINKGIIKFNSTMTDFLSPFLLMLLAIILPSIVTFACQLIPYKTISALNHAVMSKVYAFLLMMIIILPSAGFVSINAMLTDLMLPSNNTRKFRWNCLFPVNNGAFFVIYTLQAAILGNCVEILRIPELSLYVLYNLILRSRAEYQKARKYVSFEFSFGVSYPRFLLIFTMVTTYSHACPLIAPCGLFYMICKHIVDRYNIYNVYTPSKINGRIHSTAILYVHIGLIMMLFQVFTFFLTKTQYSHVTIFSLVVLIVSLLIFTFHCFYHWFRNINHLTYSVTTRLSAKKHDFCICSYTPPVFFNLIDNGLVSQPRSEETV